MNASMTFYPSFVKKELKKMPRQLRAEFEHRYGNEKRQVVTAYMLHIFCFGMATYAYRGKWLWQIAYWLVWALPFVYWYHGDYTDGWGFSKSIIGGLFLMGPPLFWFSGIFVMLFAGVRQDNAQLANRILDEVANNTEPLHWKIPYDPLHLRPENLSKNYLVDFELKTWQVTRVIQQDWEDNTSSRLLSLHSEGENRLLLIRHHKKETRYFVGESVDVRQLDRRVDFQNSPRQVLSYHGKQFYGEDSREGVSFVMEEKRTPQRLHYWDYFDKSGEEGITIARLSDKEILAYHWHKADEMDFTEILPVKN